MSDGNAYTAHVGVADAPEHGQAELPGFMQISSSLILLTWLAFLILSVLLYKIAWKPILRALSMREESIRKALEDAAKARADLAEIETKGRQMVAEAAAESEQLVGHARKAAREMMDEAQNKAKAEAEAMIVTARREIEAATAEARTALREETVDLAIRTAGVVVRENLDSAKNRALAEKLIKTL